GASADHLRANLEGFRALFQGCGENASGLGFDDWLTQVGGGELAAQMTEDLDHAESAVDAIDVNLELAVVSEPAKVQAAYEAVKLITDELKTQFVTLLNLELPKTVEGDND